jgi:hypothetical protein
MVSFEVIRRSARLVACREPFGGGSLGAREVPVVLPEKKRPTTLEGAVEQLKSEPLHGVHLYVNDDDVRAPARPDPPQNLRRMTRFSAPALGPR